MAADVAETVWYSEDSASPITVSKPASFAAGQILVAVIIQHNNPSAQSDLTTPSGWTPQGALDGTTSDGKVFSYVFTGSDPSTWAFPYRSTADVTLGLFRITGADTTPTIVVTSTPTETVTSSMDSPTVTPTGSNDLLICCVALEGNGAAFSETDPAGMTDLGQVQVAGNNFAMAACKELLASSSATGVRTWTSLSPTGTTGGTLSIAIKSGASTVAPPPFPGSRRPRALTPRRGHVFMPVPAQVIVPNPNLVQVLDRTRLKFAKYFRNRGAIPVLTQIVPPPAFVPQTLRPRVKPLAFRRHDVGAPPPEQQPPLPSVVRLRRRPPRWFRSHNTAPPPAQTAPALFERIRIRVARLFRGTIRPVVPPQVVVVPPPRVAQATKARRQQFTPRRHRGGVDGWLVPAEHLCITPRPSTGVTGQPDSGITARPDTGITEAPC